MCTVPSPDIKLWQEKLQASHFLYQVALPKLLGLCTQEIGAIAKPDVIQ